MKITKMKLSNDNERLYDYGELHTSSYRETSTNSPVISIGRAVHTALCILHQIFRLGKTSSQTYKEIVRC